jgi:hypothetical protein
MALRQPFVPDAQSAKRVKPGNRAFYGPPIDPKPTAIRIRGLSEHRYDPTGAQAAAVQLGVIAKTALDALGFTAGTAPVPLGCGNSLDAWGELGHVARLRSDQDDGKRNPLRRRNDMVRTPQLPPVRLFRTRLHAKMARADVAPITTRDQSRVSASRKSAKDAAWSRLQALDRRQVCSTGRRQSFQPFAGEDWAGHPETGGVQPELHISPLHLHRWCHLRTTPLLSEPLEVKLTPPMVNSIPSQAHRLGDSLKINAANSGLVAVNGLVREAPMRSGPALSNVQPTKKCKRPARLELITAPGAPCAASADHASPVRVRQICDHSGSCVHTEGVNNTRVWRPLRCAAASRVACPRAIDFESNKLQEPPAAERTV